MFDVNNFLSTTVSGELSTEFVPVPEGEYNAVIEEIKPRQAKDRVILDVVWNINDSRAAEATGRDKNTVRQSIFLDTTEQGTLDMAKGKNIQLGRLRAALNQNTPGAWSPNEMLGRTAKVLVSHRINEGVTYTDVKSVSAL